MKVLYLAWRDPLEKRWFPIGRLAGVPGGYEFSYVKGVNDAKENGHFTEIVGFPSLDQVYESKKLFPIFANRVPPSSRPGFEDYTQWLNVAENADDPLILLARNGGRRETDTFEVFPSPERQADGTYHLHFFAHGLSHFPESSLERVDRLAERDPLYLVHDLQNPFDTHALFLRTAASEDDRDRHLIGWCPRYLLDPATFDHVIQNPNSASVKVEKMNPPPAPLRMRLLCNITLSLPSDLRLLSGEEYTPISRQAATV